MKRSIEALTDGTLDVLILGGGITEPRGPGWGTCGVGAIGLIDKGDFASGTSSVSSKLIHGGLATWSMGPSISSTKRCTNGPVIAERSASGPAAAVFHALLPGQPVAAVEVPAGNDPLRFPGRAGEYPASPARRRPLFDRGLSRLEDRRLAGRRDFSTPRWTTPVCALKFS